MGASASVREALLNSYLSASLGGNLQFDPRDDVSGSFLGSNGIRVDVISTEDATGIELAPGSPYGGADGTSKTETVTAYIGIVVLDSIEPSASPSASAHPTSSRIPSIAPSTSSSPTISIVPSASPSEIPSASPSASIELVDTPDDSVFPEDTHFRLQPFDIHVPGGAALDEQVFLGMYSVWYTATMRDILESSNRAVHCQPSNSLFISNQHDIPTFSKQKSTFHRYQLEPFSMAMEWC
jgi:hypothetical protein